MTDGDVFHRHPARAWTAAWLLLVGGHPADHVAAAVDKALAATVRNGGLPRCDDFVGVAEAVAQGKQTVSQAFDQIHHLEREVGGSREARLAARACEQLVVAASNNPASLGLDTRQTLADHYLAVVTESNLFGRIRPELQGRKFLDAGEAPLFEAPYRAELQPRRERLAQRLAADPTIAHPERIRASGLRRPQTRQALEEVLA